MATPLNSKRFPVKHCPECRTGRQCRRCHAAYMRAWRAKQKGKLLRERLRSSRIREERNHLRAELGLQRIAEKYSQERTQ